MNSGTVWASIEGCTTMTKGLRRDVADEIEIEFVVERRVDRCRRACREQRVARRRLHDRLNADIAGSTRPVLDDEWLACRQTSKVGAECLNWARSDLVQRG